jgi:exodeoxyribonuclease I
LFRYRARNWPDALTAPEAQRWDDYRRTRLTQDRGLSEFTFDTHRAEIAVLRQTHADDAHAQVLLDQLQAWAHSLESDLT